MWKLWINVEKSLRIPTRQILEDLLGLTINQFNDFEIFDLENRGTANCYNHTLSGLRTNGSESGKLCGMRIYTRSFWIN